MARSIPDMSHFSACHFAEFASDAPDGIVGNLFCSYCGVRNPEVIKRPRIDNVADMKNVELTIRRFADGDAPYADVETLIIVVFRSGLGDFIKHVQNVRQQDGRPAWEYDAEHLEWIKVKKA